MADTIFYLAIAAMCVQALILVAFYFTAYQRLFFTSGASNLIPVLLFLLFFKIAYPITYLAGWAKCDSRGVARVMIFWTLEMIIVAVEITLLLNMPSNGSGILDVIISTASAIVMSLLCIAGLKVAWQVDSRLRKVLNEPTEDNLKQVAALGPSVLPLLERMLESQFAPTRLVAVRCLGNMGSLAIPLLKSSLTDDDPAIVEQVDESLALIQQQQVAPN